MGIAGVDSQYEEYEQSQVLEEDFLDDVHEEHQNALDKARTVFN